MTALPFTFNDGGRAETGFKGTTGDCSTRAIAIATDQPYLAVYDALTARGKRCKITKVHRTQCSARLGVCKKVIREYLADLGWTWTPTMQIGSGTTVHLAPGELPPGHLIVFVSRHTVAVIDGVVHDTYDPTREGTRAVYGYWWNPEEAARQEAKYEAERQARRAKLAEEDAVFAAKHDALLARARRGGACLACRRTIIRSPLHPRVVSSPSDLFCLACRQDAQNGGC